jgi:PKD domain/Pectate lyase superfamily protein
MSNIGRDEVATRRVSSLAYGRSFRPFWSRRALGVAVCGVLGGVVIGPLAGMTAHAQQTFNVVTYGADATGVKDSTVAVQNAINAAQAAGTGNIVYFPTGNYIFFKQISSKTSLTVNSGNAVTLQGDGPNASVLNEGVGKNLLLVQADGSIINQLRFNAQPNSLTTHAQAALIVAANNTLLENSAILGGPNTFALYYPAPPGATKTNIIYYSGNHVDGITINDQWNRDGFSFAFQENGLIQNVDHTGSRLAIFVDKNLEIDNYTYHPGTTKASQGWWITAPSDGIAINHFVTDGNGGTISQGGTPSTNISINNEVFNNPGFHLTVGEVKGLTINGCNFGANNDLHFNSENQATNVLVENCTALPVVRFAQPKAAPGNVQVTFSDNTYPAFTPATGEGPQTFLNITGSKTDFTVNGGTFHNCAGGFFKGANTTFAVNNLTGYPCSKDSAPQASLSLSPQPCNLPCTLSADASGSTDTDKTPIVDYQFNWGDGTSSARQPSSSLTHAYKKPGKYTVTVDVIDAAGLNSTAEQTANVAAVNLVGNPGFECNCLTGWAHIAGSKLVLTSTSHSGSFAAQVGRKSGTGHAGLQDSPPWNGNTQAGTSCHVSAWVQAPAGKSIFLRLTERQGTTIVAHHNSSVADSSGTWVQLTGVAHIVNAGDVLQLRIYATLSLGQTLLVDDISEACY